jgi:hypothetical protein
MKRSDIPNDINRLISVSPGELKTHLEYVLILQKHIRHYLDIHEMTKIEVMQYCQLSEAQYYRHLKNPKRFDIETLTKVVDLVKPQS